MDDIQPPLPTSVDSFDQDDRISFSKLDNKYLAVHDDGTEFEFDTATRTWALAEDEPLHDDEALHGHGIPQEQTFDMSRKRKDFPGSGYEGNHNNSHADNDNNSNHSSNKPSRPSKKQKSQPQPRQNTAVYVTGLPSDATVDEVHELFSRKGGVIAEEIDSGRPRIKMYTDESGNFKGDALVVFFKPQSVEMAIMLLDDTDFRFTTGANSSDGGRMKVQAADSSYKKTKYEDEGGGSGAKQGGGQEQSKPKGNDRDRQRIIKKTQKLDAKLADWSDDEPSLMPAEAAIRHGKVVILKHMFTLEELEEDPAALLDIKEDIREECAKLGGVTNVVLFDEEPDGIVSVKFREPESALACVQVMGGRSFDGRVVEAYISTGKERFKQSKKGKHDDSHDED